MKFNTIIKGIGFIFFVVAIITLFTGLEKFEFSSSGFDLLAKTLKDTFINVLIGIGCFVFEAKVLN